MAGVGKVFVRALRDGFRRAGRDWLAEGVMLSLDALTQAQWRALEAEPLVQVTRAPDEMGHAPAAPPPVSPTQPTGAGTEAEPDHSGRRKRRQAG